MKTYTNFKKIFLVRVFWLKYIFQIKFKIPILDLMLLPKNSVPFEGLYSSNEMLNVPLTDLDQEDIIIYKKTRGPSGP